MSDRQSPSLFRWTAAALVGSLALLALGRATLASACPFCTATAQTFTEEIGTMDAAVVAKLVALPKESGSAPGTEVARARFEVVRVIKGEKFVAPRQAIETLYFGDAKIGSSFLITGINPEKPMWSTPLPISARGEEYLTAILALPKDGIERYKFFQDYLEDGENILARDAYDEFAKAPYAMIQELKPFLNHDKLLGWIKNPEVSGGHRRLYLVMLGICGTADDLPFLESLLQSKDRKQKSGLDAIIACYLTLKGPEGLPLVEELYLKNPKADYAETYSAIMALRFHGSEGGVIPRERVVKGLRYMLDRSELADLVIPDLAKWEDWDSTDRLMELYRKPSDTTSWLRVPVINFLRVSPLANAKVLLEECEKLDPAAMKRANAYFPKPNQTTVPAADKASYTEPLAPEDNVLPHVKSIPGSVETVAFEAPIPVATDEAAIPGAANSGGASEPKLSAQRNSSGLNAKGTKPGRLAQAGSDVVASVNRGAPPAAALESEPTKALPLWLLVGIPWLVGGVLFWAQWSIIRGAGTRVS